PGFIGLIYFPGLIWLAFRYMGGSADYLRENWVPGWLDYAIVVWIVTVALWMGGAYLGFSLYRNVVMIIYGPVLGIVSEKTEAGLQSHAVPPNQQGSVWRGMKRGTLMSITSLALSLVVLICCWALVLIPVLGGLLLAISLPLCQMFLAGQGFFDPTLERKGHGIRASLRYCWRNRMRTIGCGAGFTLLALIPIVGWFLAPGFGIVAGTRSVVELMDTGENES
ncbi:MAG TPA: hypothetical protein DCY13_23860, partial [Verrucomicrobiales bacterium]|nr:hypothetical protein [Verrucomicrobiales bacterium]